MQSGNVNCQVIDVLKELEGVSQKAVGGTNVIYTRSVPTEQGVSYSFEYAFTSPGVIDVKAELEQGNIRPATEGAASTDFVVPKDAAAFEDGANSAAVRIKAYAPAATAFMRLKFTGQGSNNAGTVLARCRVALIK